jgi:tetratricopeptide (TPR) repeat protein
VIDEFTPMSLLIKALDKAEKAQEEQLKSQKSRRRCAANIANHDVTVNEDEIDLQLERPEHNLTQEFYQYSNEANERAANVFEAKQPHASTAVSPMVWIAGLGLLALLTIGGYFYYQLSHLNAPPAATPAEQVVAQQKLPEEIPIAASPAVDSPEIEPAPTVDLPQVSTLADNKPTQPEAKSAVDELPLEEAPQIFASKSAPAAKRSSANRVNQSLAPGEQKIEPKSPLSFGAPIASESVSIQVSSAKKSAGLNPNLVNAYNAYSNGQDTEAQALYKKVLQQDTRNVDALLGLGAIAEKQGRLSDAQGWYQKVLELEPRNAIALAAFYDYQQPDESTATQFKNLIAKEPSNANLHAGLGNLYAEQNQWSEAQQAYFEAYRLNPSAENTFNLAVALDQMGKPALALPYYQQAMQLSQQKANSPIDTGALQQRISAIQLEQ